MEREILHCDLNNFYASVECALNPALFNVPVAVCGDATLRHGIVLAKNQLAKQYGIRTGDVIWEAKKKCGQLVLVTAHHGRYAEYSRRAIEIYKRYTDQIESFGIDECWLDVTKSKRLFGSGSDIADKIRQDIKNELNCTISVGVSYNKVFAKMGSDLKKPDATTVIDRQNYKQLLFKLPARELFYVGKSTEATLKKLNIVTIGDIARADVAFLRRRLGKWGEQLWVYANGYDDSVVSMSGQSRQIKSVSNSSTASRDLVKEQELLALLTMMAESVSQRLRKHNLKGLGVSVFLRDDNLSWWEKQTRLDCPTFLACDIIKCAMSLIEQNYEFKPVRSVGVRVFDLVDACAPHQSDFFTKTVTHEKLERAEKGIDSLRQSLGHNIIKRACVFKQEDINGHSDEDATTHHSFQK